MKTAAIVIIGNEILSGRTKDMNSSYLAGELRRLGVDLGRIAVVPDDLDAIGREVSYCSSAFDLVFTAGGVGPTHDDVTMEGIARGFGLKTVRNSRLMETIRLRCGGEAGPAAAKMAMLPEGAELIEAEGMGFPAVMLKNVYIFPGIPEFLRRKFEALKERFRSSPFVIRKLYVDEEECAIAPFLDRVVAEHPEVQVGSYPRPGLKHHKVVVTLEGRDGQKVEEASRALIGLLPKGSVVRTA